MVKGDHDELVFLIVSALVVLAFVAHLHGPGLSSVTRMAAVGSVLGDVPLTESSASGQVPPAQSASESLPTPVCPFAATDSISVVKFEDTQLVGVAGPFELSYAVSIAPGTYAVRAFGYDQAPDRAGKVDQRYEQWLLDLYVQGSRLETFGPTQDLEDGLILTRSFDTLAETFTVHQTIDELVVRHAHPTRADNSVTPVCVAFERQE